MQRRVLDSGDLGHCRLPECEADLTNVTVELVHEERDTPRYPDGTPNFFPMTVGEGELLFRIFEVDEVCEAGHRTCFTRHFSSEKKFMFDTPFVVLEESMVFGMGGPQI